MFRTLCLFALLAVACGTILPPYNMTQKFGDPHAVGEAKTYYLDILEYACTSTVNVNKKLCDYPKSLEVGVFDWQPIKYILLKDPTKKQSTLEIIRSEPCSLIASVRIDAIC